MNKQVFSKIWVLIILIILIGGGILVYQYWWAPRQLEFEAGRIGPPKGIEEEKFISEEEAINLVKNLPEVKEWLTLFTGPGGTGPTTGGTSMIVVDSKSDQGYQIHAYEQMSDHTATFNWYSIDAKTGEVKPMF